MRDAIGLYEKLQQVEHTRILFSVKKVDETKQSGNTVNGSVPGNPNIPLVPQPSLQPVETSKELWDHGKEQFLTANYPDMSAAKIARVLCVPPNIIYHHINRLNLNQIDTSKISLSREQMKFLRDNFGKALSPEQIAKQIGMKTKDVYAIAKELKLQQVLPPDEEEVQEKVQLVNPTNPTTAIEKAPVKSSTANGKWDDEKEKFLLENHENMNPNKIGKHLGLSPGTIIYHLKRLGLRDSLTDHIKAS